MNNLTVQFAGISAIAYGRIAVVQLMLVIFLFIDTLLIFTFFQKDYFRTRMRYIFFIHILFCDWLYLCISNILMILSFTGTLVVVGVCVWLVVVACLLTFSTPLTMVAMSIERYVAICLPLRHAEISTVVSACYCILIIHGLSSIQIIVAVYVFIVSVPVTFYTTYKVCQVELLFIFKWHSYLRSAISQFYFMVMSCIILYTYIKIISVVKLVASSNTKNLVSKGRNTVILHAVQLFLCMFQFWTPFVEAALLDVSIDAYIVVRYFDYVMFLLAPRCLCPLVYGLRDEKFFLALKHHMFYRLRNTIMPSTNI